MLVLVIFFILCIQISQLLEIVYLQRYIQHINIDYPIVKEDFVSILLVTIETIGYSVYEIIF